MAFVSGFLGLLSAVGSGTATELALPGYQRQAVSFARPLIGRSLLATPYSFGTLGMPGPLGNTDGTIAGRAVYDAPIGGRLLLVLPFPAPRPLPGGGPTDQQEAGHIHLELSDLAGWPDGDAYSGAMPAASVVGDWWEEPSAFAVRAPLSTGVALSITRGTLAAA